MILLSIDPGLDLVAIARWDWERPGQPADRALLSVTSFHTEPDAPIGDRLAAIAAHCEEASRGAGLVLVERPTHGGAYDRNIHRKAAIAKAMYWSTLASGAIGVGIARAGTPSFYLEVGTVKKETKQAIARAVLQRTGLVPIGKRRTAWNGDELDAVAVGMQGMGDPTVCRLAFPPGRRVA